ncbi:AfsR/SARP family transcriptional regulator [Kitasatospora griseola]|uniref:AfsR/SARP family transcriptional regulator n=1 Tax=Kitasatospora griseola TaxID=2064 RepID=UPI0034171832
MGDRTGWQFGVLGPLEVRYDGCVLTLGSTRQRAALTALVAAAGRTVPVAELIDAVWEEEAPPSALNSLQSHLSRLRSRLVAVSGAPVLGYDPAGYRLLVTPERIDVRRFERAAAAGREQLAGGRPDRALELLREALGLWRGAALGEFRDHCSLRADSARLEELRLLTVESAAAAELALRRPDDAATRLTALVAEHPLRERALARLMLALYRTGRQADALALYRRSRRRLVAELGVEPGAELAGTQQAILRHDPALRPGPDREDRLPAVPREVERHAVALAPDEGPDTVGEVGVAARPVAAGRGIAVVAEESPRRTPADAPTAGSEQRPEVDRPAHAGPIAAGTRHRHVPDPWRRRSPHRGPAAVGAVHVLPPLFSAARPEVELVGEGLLSRSTDDPRAPAAPGGGVFPVLAAVVPRIPARAGTAALGGLPRSSRAPPPAPVRPRRPHPRRTVDGPCDPQRSPPRPARDRPRGHGEQWSSGRRIPLGSRPPRSALSGARDSRSRSGSPRPTPSAGCRTPECPRHP